MSAPHSDSDMRQEYVTSYQWMGGLDEIVSTARLSFVPSIYTPRTSKFEEVPLGGKFMARSLRTMILKTPYMDFDVDRRLLTLNNLLFSKNVGNIILNEVDLLSNFFPSVGPCTCIERAWGILVWIREPIVSILLPRLLSISEAHQSPGSESGCPKFGCPSTLFGCPLCQRRHRPFARGHLLFFGNDRT